MKRIWIVPFFVLAMFLASCGSENGAVAKLDGDWVLNLDASIENNPELKKNIPADASGEMARELAAKMLGDITFSFDVKNATLTGSMMGRTGEAKKYEVVSVKGNDVEIRTEGKERAVRFSVTDTEMRVFARDGSCLVFKRK